MEQQLLGGRFEVLSSESRPGDLVEPVDGGIVVPQGPHREGVAVAKDAQHPLEEQLVGDCFYLVLFHQRGKGVEAQGFLDEILLESKPLLSRWLLLHVDDGLLVLGGGSGRKPFEWGSCRLWAETVDVRWGS